MVNIKQSTDGGMRAEGNPKYTGGFVAVNYLYDTTFDGKDIFVANRDFVVTSISIRPKVAGTDSSAVTMTVRKAADASAADSTATALHATGLNLKGTANTVQHATLTTANCKLPKGYSLGLDASGTLTAAVGLVTILLAPA